MKKIKDLSAIPNGRRVLFVLALCFFLPGAAATAEPEEGGWGVNARLSLLDPAEMEQRILLLREAGVLWVREDFRAGPKRAVQEEAFARLRHEGFKVMALVPYGAGQKPADPRNRLQEDLRVVFEKARQWAESSANVDAWENYNEADVGFCPDLPDRSTAYMKAVYLGLRVGGGSNPPPVLMGALALPPGPWLERAARNGLLDYADAYNLHYYGIPGDFGSVLQIHRAFLQRDNALQRIGRRRSGEMSLWVTECGYSARDGIDGDRLTQAENLKDMAEIAQKRGAASFMPFSLSYRKSDGLGLLDITLEPYPAWGAFAGFAKDHGLHGEFLEKNSADPLIVQWVPYPGKSLPHKVSGSYRFLEEADGRRLPIQGEFRFYNFGNQPRSINWSIQGLEKIHAEAGGHGRVDVGAGKMIAIPVIFNPPQEGYVNEACSVLAGDSGEEKTEALYFRLETRPATKNFQVEPIRWISHGDKAWPFHYLDAPFPSVESGFAGPWMGINGLQPLGAYPPGNSLTFRVNKTSSDTLPMAIAGLQGLPSKGFIHLSSNLPFGPDFHVRVDLIDRRGQRFTIFENFGISYFERSNEVWLNLKDFHPYFWGRCVNPFFDPTSVREIQLRPHVKESGKEVKVKIDLMLPANPAPSQ